MSETPLNFRIVKVSATGNDFLLVDLLDTHLLAAWKSELAQRSRGELARTWCDRHESLGADGLVILEADPQHDFAWDFYNSDGGSAEMCGNAARAVSLYVNKKYGKSKLSFKTRVGVVTATVHSEKDIEVILPAVKEAEWNQSAQEVKFDFIRPGVPHAVVRVHQLKPIEELRATALKIKATPRFLKEGVNVTFVHPLSETSAESVTFERGVENFTLACGTGAIAAAFSLVRGEEGKTLEIQVPGGRLRVVWKNHQPHLRGPAKVVAEMRLFREA